ncbi:MAG: cache domain-containing protein [Alphaproteobacteria bacterium]|nr:cache domain-containing protein [Alphaproteobacteria bacterium]
MIYRKKIKEDNKWLLLKLALPVFATLALFIYVIFFVHLPNIKESMIKQKKTAISELSNFVNHTIDTYYQEEVKKVLSREEAQEKAKEMIRGFRYGADGKNYFWITTMEHVMVMHPYRLDLEGVDMTNLKDINGKQFVRNFATIVRKYGSGYEEYMWQWKDNPDLIVKKFSYLKGFKPWDWFIGTGVYYMDVDVEATQLVKEQLKVTLVILCIVFVLVSFSMWQSRRAVIRLRASEKNLYITLNSIGDAVITTDAKSNITMMNPIAVNLTGWKEKEAFGKPINKVMNLIGGGNFSGASAKNILNKEDKNIHLGYNVLLSKNGKQYHVSSNGAPIKNLFGVTIGAVMVFRDVSEQCELEERLRQSQKMETLGQLTGGVAHDFNNMLSGIIGGAELLLEKVKNEAQLKKHVDMIIEAAERATSLTSKLLDFSRKGKMVSSPIDVHTSIKDTCQLLERSINRSIKIITELKATNAIVTGDPVQIQNMVLNLSLNARDAISGEGEIRISTEQVEIDNFFCQRSVFDINPGNYIEVSIADNGSGISEELMEKIFEPFFTTKKIGEGTGLGLSAVYGSVKDHNGDIRVYSDLGKGSVFKIYLPLKGKATYTAKKRTKIKKGTGCILIIDDEILVQKMVQEMIQKMGYETIVASNGKEGIKAYKKNSDRIDLVLLDIIMPEMNGYDVFYELKKINKDVKVLLSSGFGFDASISDLIKDGATDFIKKPHRYSVLNNVIADILEKNDN